jgi:hypothetical protein
MYSESEWSGVGVRSTWICAAGPLVGARLVVSDGWNVLCSALIPTIAAR